jgi:hypothetical protein
MNEVCIIRDFSVVNGPNKWSAVHHKLITFQILYTDSEKLANPYYDDLFPFTTKEKEEIDQHTNSQMKIAIMVSIISLYLQRISGALVSYRHSFRKDNNYYAVIEYEKSEHGKVVVCAAINLLKAYLKGHKPILDTQIEKLKCTYSSKLDVQYSISQTNDLYKKDRSSSTVIRNTYTLQGIEMPRKTKDRKNLMSKISKFLKRS